MCDCVKNMDAHLKDHNAQLAFGFQTTKSMNLVSRLLVGTEKIDKTKRKPLPHVMASFCPFCGVKMNEEA